MEIDSAQFAINHIMTDYYSCGTTLLSPGGYYYTGASNSTAVVIWSAFDDEIKEKGFDNVSSISGSFWIFIMNDGKKESYELEGITVFGG